MSAKMNEVLATALSLSENERAELATKLLDSLDERGSEKLDPSAESVVQSAWAAELTERVRRLDAELASGRSPGRAWSEVRADLARKRG